MMEVARWRIRAIRGPLDRRPPPLDQRVAAETVCAVIVDVADPVRQPILASDDLDSEIRIMMGTVGAPGRTGGPRVHSASTTRSPPLCTRWMSSRLRSKPRSSPDPPAHHPGIMKIAPLVDQAARLRFEEERLHQTLLQRRDDCQIVSLRGPL